jgi:hypothetical protein
LSKPRNDKDLALRTLRKNSDELSDEELALVARKFYKFRHRIPKSFEKPEERDPRGPKCYECSGYGHLRKD